MKKAILFLALAMMFIAGCAQPIGDEIGILLADKSDLEFIAPVGGSSEMQTVSIMNAGSITAVVSVITDRSWLSASPPVLEIETDDACFVDVSCSCIGLSVGEYNGTVIGTASDALGSPIIFDVTLTCFGIDDAYESNDIPADASVALYDSPGVWLSDIAGMGIANEGDIFSLEIPAGDWILSAELIFFDELGNIDLCIQDEKATDIECETSRSDDEIAEIEVTGPGIYLLYVYPATGADIGNAYDLMWTIVSIPVP